MIYVFLAHGFEEIEAVTAIDILRRAGLDVLAVGIGAKAITGSHGITVAADIQDHEIVYENIQAIVLPGGMPGTLNLERSAAVSSMLDYAVNNDIIIAAICAAPSVLGHKGILKGRTATCFPGFEQQLDGAAITEQKTVADGNIITAKGPGCSAEFALMLAARLTSPKRSDLVKASLQ